MDRILYSVSIAPFASTDDTTTGFIDNKTPVEYGTDSTNTYEQSQIKTRGNLRFRTLIDTIALTANPIMQNIVAVGATLTTDATAFTFDVFFAQDENMTLWTDEGELLTGVDALTYSIGTALTKGYTIRADIFDPTVSDGGMAGLPEVVRTGDRFELLTVGALAETVDDAMANVTITTSTIEIPLNNA